MVLKQEPAEITWGKKTEGHNSEQPKNKAISLTLKLYITT